MESARWQPHPEGINTGIELSRVRPGRVVGIGALCDLGPEPSDASRAQSFSVSEFVRLEDGRHVMLHADRGFTLGRAALGGGGSGAVTDNGALESMIQNVLTVVLPDDESSETHPWSWLTALARARGLNVRENDLRDLPYEVIFTEESRRWIASS